MKQRQIRALRWVCYSLFLIVLPWLPTILSGIISSVLSCTVNEAGANPCFLFGSDIGRILYLMGVFGWVAIFITPITVLIFIFNLISFLKELVSPSE